MRRPWGKNWDWKGEERLGTDVDSHFNIFPIPESELMNNPTLKQNKGYTSTSAVK